MPQHEPGLHQPLLSPLPVMGTTTSSTAGGMQHAPQHQNRHRTCACLLLAALAAGCAMGWWGGHHHQHAQTVGHPQQQPEGRLVHVQVVFRHGARAPLSQRYWTNAAWRHCSEEPLQPSAHDKNSSSGGISLSLFDPSGAPQPPELSGGDAPQLPGGCRMGSLTDTGFQEALALGAQLRRRYIQSTPPLLPQQCYSPCHVSARSTAVRRTVTTLRGVLSGLWPGSAAVVPVAVRPHREDWMTGDVSGCPVLANLSMRLVAQQAARDATDASLHAFERQVHSALQLLRNADITTNISSSSRVNDAAGSPAAAPREQQQQQQQQQAQPPLPLRWMSLMDESICATAEGEPPAAVAAHPALMQRVEHLTTQREVAALAPEADHCLLVGNQREQQCRRVTALTIGRLLHELVANMQKAAAAAASAAAGGSSGAGGRRLLAESQQQQQQQQQDTHGKLMLFAAHDTTLLPLLSALGQHQDSWPSFASWLAFELRVSASGQASVRVLHNGVPLELPLSAAPHTIRGVTQLVSATSQRARRAAGQLLAALLRGGQLDAAHEKGSAAAVVSLADFTSRVLKDYVLSPEAYRLLCSSG